MLSALSLAASLPPGAADLSQGLSLSYLTLTIHREEVLRGLGPTDSDWPASSLWSGFFFKEAAICKLNSNGWRDCPPPTSSVLQWTHPSLSDVGCIPFPPVHLSLLNEQECCLQTQVACLWSCRPIGCLSSMKGASVNVSKPESWQKLNDSYKPATCCLFKAFLSIFAALIDCLMSVGSQKRVALCSKTANQGGRSLEWKLLNFYWLFSSAVKACSCSHLLKRHKIFCFLYQSQSDFL